MGNHIQESYKNLGIKIGPMVMRALGYLPITESSDDDVFIVSYPRSGNSWLAHLILGIFYDENPETIRYSAVRNMIPDVHLKRCYRRCHSPMFFKSHHLPRPEYKRVLYIARDGRDVMVSCYHYYSASLGKDIDFMEMIRGKGLDFGKWHDHVESWLSNPYKAKMLLVKYEDMVKDTVGELKRLCIFFGIKKDISVLETAAERASFEKLRQKEIKHGIDYRGWPRDKMFFRRGKVGSYKDEMPWDALEAFTGEAEGTLRKLGYLCGD